MGPSSAVAFVAALVAFAPPLARANPPDTYGFASRETAMGNAASAETRGYAASYYNPAALVRSQGLELAVGYFRASHAMTINGLDTGVDPVKGINGGLVVPGKLFGVPFAFGLAVHLPDDRISRVRALRQEQPRWELYDNRNQRLFLAANVAFQPLPWLQIGGGLSFMSSTRGRLDITGNANIFTPDDSQLRHEVDADLTAIRYPQAGIRVELSNEIALAAVYRGEFQLSLDLGAHLSGDVSGLTTALYELETHSVNNFLPQQVVLGGSWQLAKNLRGAFDMTWMNWSAYVPPVARLDVVLDIPPPAGGWPPSISPPQAVAATRIEPLRMHDRIIPHVGLEWRVVGTRKVEAFFRGGYEYSKSPIEPQTGLTNYLDRDRHTISTGFGGTLHGLAREVPGSLSLDLHFAFSELVSDTTYKASAADFVGDYVARGSIVNIGATMSFAFDGADGEKR
ncbi:MAG: outer membrane protein transport protein [Deltaproteobacteria bacterium]|nr:outer membrane protein transport protein [Deltaproteobacteria bacterium]